MRPIVITGKIGSGKSTLCKLFEKYNYFIINSDIYAKDLIIENKIIRESLTKHYGDRIALDQTISLDKLKNILCSSRKDKDIIDSIIHPVFYKEINKFIKNIKSNKIVIEIPLVETCKSLDMDHVIVYVDTEKLIRKTRYLEKKSTDNMIFENLDKFQIDREASMKLSDYIISNNGNMDQLIVNFNDLYRNLNK